MGLEIPLIYRLKRPLRELGFPVLNQLKSLPKAYLDLSKVNQVMCQALSESFFS